MKTVDAGLASRTIRRYSSGAGRLTFSIAMACCLVSLGRAEESVPEFDRDIRPILSDRCFTCHGPDDATREAGLRIDRPEGIFSATESGVTPVVPGNPGESELVRRILSGDPDERMPPPDAIKQLTDEERQKIVRWVMGGAKYQRHWAFVPPTRPSVPTVSQPSWVRNAIDAFVLASLDQHQLIPSPEAPRTTLIRRLYLDLLGLPPTPEQVEAFLNDNNPDAYERLVDDILMSPHFGERMALDWLDAARFADTNGYHLDNGRDMSLWRAWVIEAFNQNMPFDQFTIEQLAGDLIPDATEKQRIASGFHRNHMINFEGGAIPEEYHAAYIVDRVNTTGTVWLGLTVGCAQCHDHKFDPITQREYYQLYAFFNNVPEKGLDGNQGNAEPLLPFPSPEQEARQRVLAAQIAALKGLVDDENSATDVLRKEQAAALEKRQQEQAQLAKEMPSTMVMQESPGLRETHVLIRGQYDQLGMKVTAKTPESLPPMPDDLPRDRLGLARWLVSAEQPLTSRVIANRIWQMFFGQGIVSTAEDFGSQGDLPSHPALLDWLACELQHATAPQVAGTSQESWNLKAFVKTIVMSSTYRQHSVISANAQEKDPGNRLLSRAPRIRLPAELIRDQALAASGLLKHKIGGPSVSPYQPGDLWRELSSREDSSNWTAQFFVQSHGEDLYRRGLYTFWKRTCPPVQLATFDAPDRETCTVRRARTNTPLQALILLNDPTYLEAARKLAERVLLQPQSQFDERIEFAFKALLCRTPTARETQVLQNLLQERMSYYSVHPQAAAELLTAGESPRDESLDVPELASWTMVASSILNLDEAVTRN
jgi:Protein of unknown function (DUF1553)/Protein of unknown function (DUF1549)/Planctomycete cytochrome C